MNNSLLERCLLFSDSYSLLPPKEGRLLCAVSGGADSVCLLLLMCEAGRQRGFTPVCAHYDHGLRGDESRRDAEFVQDLCARLGVEFFLGNGDVSAEAKRLGQGIEETAREMRYAFLRECAANCGAMYIATAHNLRDNAETMLLNLARGTGTAGLGGISPKRRGVVRPLLFADRAEIEAFLRENEQIWVTDSSNLSNIYARNRLRKEAIPALESVNPHFARHALQTAERLRADEECLTMLAECFLQENSSRAGRCIAVRAEALEKLPEPVRYRAIRKLCGASLESCHVEAIEKLLAPLSSGKAVDIPGMQVRRSFDKLYFGEPEISESLTVRYLDGPGECVLPEVGILVRRSDGVPCDVHKSFNIFCFQMTEPCGRITIRSVAAGDSIRLPGRGCTKTLKKLFSEAGIPEWERGRIPVLADEKGILAVAGFGADERRLAQQGEKAMKIEIIREDNERA